jgi:hypothetical protein
LFQALTGRGAVFASFLQAAMGSTGFNSVLDFPPETLAVLAEISHEINSSLKLSASSITKFSPFS